MAHRLELKTTEDTNGVRVSWNDLAARDLSPYAKNLILIGTIPWFLFFAFLTAIETNLLFLIIALGGIGFALWYLSSSEVKKKSVLFDLNCVSFGETKINNEDVSRIDYGLESQLKGSAPQQDEPTLIRIWVEDRIPITVSVNKWNNEVNHQIRQALDQALRSVQKSVADKNKKDKFGETGDDGMPDY